MTDYDNYCKEKVNKSGSSFYYSFLFLPKKQQQAIMALYAFCREVDDIVDGELEKSLAMAKLNFWQEELTRIYDNKPLHPVGKALREAIFNFALPKVLFEEILKGMVMDLQYAGYQTFEDLKLYCHCVASCVGLLAVEIFGFKNVNTREYAKNLGIAFQLVNIIRDIGEDARRGRIYIPVDELKQFNLTEEDILERRYTDNFKALLAFQSQRAKTFYQNALLALPKEDTLAQKSGLIMAEIYFTVLSEIEKIQFQVLNQKIGLPPLRKLWIAFKTNRKIKKNVCLTTSLL